jgi:hypothetical protein
VGQLAGPFLGPACSVLSDYRRSSTVKKEAPCRGRDVPWPAFASSVWRRP